MLLETIAETHRAQADLLELRRLLDALIDVDADPTGDPKEMAIRVGNTAIVQTGDDIQFWVGDRYISFDDFYQTIDLWKRLANGGRADEVDRRIPAGGGGGGTVTNATIRAALSNISPITYSNITGSIGIQMASDTQAGALSAADWSTFNGKQNSNTRLNAIVNQTTPTTDKNIVLGSTGIKFVDPPATASGTTAGLLSATDWTIFNGKQDASSRLAFITDRTAPTTGNEQILLNSAGGISFAPQNGSFRTYANGNSTISLQNIDPAHTRPTTYTLEVQSLEASTWLSITNGTQPNMGVFFGISGSGAAGDWFDQFNWQGGGIRWWVNTLPSGAGVAKAMTLSNTGNLSIPGQVAPAYLNGFASPPAAANYGAWINVWAPSNTGPSTTYPIFDDNGTWRRFYDHQPIGATLRRFYNPDAIGDIDGMTTLGAATPGSANFTTVNVGTLTNPNNATINAVQATAGRAVFNLQAPAAQTASSFLLRNSAGNALVAFRGGNSTGGNGPGVTAPVGGAIAIGDGTGAPLNVVGMRQTGFTTFLSGVTADKTITNPTTVAQSAAAIKAIYDALKTHGLVD